MGELIMFRPQKGPLCKIRAPDDQAGAQIVFFTGVRYRTHVRGCADTTGNGL